MEVIAVLLILVFFSGKWEFTFSIVSGVFCSELLVCCGVIVSCIPYTRCPPYGNRFDPLDLFALLTDPCEKMKKNEKVRKET